MRSKHRAATLEGLTFTRDGRLFVGEDLTGVSEIDPNNGLPLDHSSNPKLIENPWPDHPRVRHRRPRPSRARSAAQTPPLTHGGCIDFSSEEMG